MTTTAPTPLTRKTEAWIKATETFINQATLRASDLAQSAARVTKENNAVSMMTTTTSTINKQHGGMVPWNSTLEDLQEQLDSLNMVVKEAPRLERLVGLSEKALDAFERLVDQAETLATVKHGFDKSSSLLPVPSTQAEKMRDFGSVAATGDLNDDDEPPTPPRLSGQ